MVVPSAPADSPKAPQDEQLVADSRVQLPPADSVECRVQELLHQESLAEGQSRILAPHGAPNETSSSHVLVISVAAQDSTKSRPAQFSTETSVDDQ